MRVVSPQLTIVRPIARSPIAASGSSAVIRSPDSGQRAGGDPVFDVVDASRSLGAEDVPLPSESVGMDDEPLPPALRVLDPDWSAHPFTPATTAAMSSP
ncbi:hypothetical protein ACIBSV_09895 [Embleya sp. NPDC050154]|uniref:hypothetical protein n=1 Tax=Embleya sp. NPDC050154 TaxID=3363988 RepID=UPI00379A4BC2